MDIAPGYDFSIDETPTYNKFLLAAKRLKVTNLDFNDVTASIRLMLNGQQSGGSGASLAAEGWMWYDPNGDLWLRQRWTWDDFGMTGQSEEISITPLVRTLGGYASCRMPFWDGANPEGGRPVYAKVLAADDSKEYSPANVGFSSGWVTFQADSAPFWGYQPDTMVSGARQCFVGRGGVRQWIGTFPANETQPHRMTSSNGIQYQSLDMNDTTYNYKRWTGELYGHGPESVLSGSNRTNWCMKWVYSKAMHGHFSAT
jgi:hypothetical protein